jgi:hypothetical protein
MPLRRKRKNVSSPGIGYAGSVLSGVVVQLEGLEAPAPRAAVAPHQPLADKKQK